MVWSEQALEWTDDHERTLRSLEVSEHGPGTVLRDFLMLLSFVQERELAVSKTYQLLPFKVLPAINARLAQPIELGLKRPQLKSYPHIQGLYLLLRASGLGRIDGTSSKLVLSIDEAVYDSWNRLNPTERYFTLLETWLLRGHVGIVGERGSPFRFIGNHFRECAGLLRLAQGEGLAIGDDDRAEWYYRYSLGLYGLALLEAFGFLSILHGQPHEGEGWQIEHVTSTPVGIAAFALLGKEMFGDLARSSNWRRTLRNRLVRCSLYFNPMFPPGKTISRCRRGHFVKEYTSSRCHCGVTFGGGLPCPVL